jgi:hypothetical protein
MGTSSDRNRLVTNRRISPTIALTMSLPMSRMLFVVPQMDTVQTSVCSPQRPPLRWGPPPSSSWRAEDNPTLSKIHASVGSHPARRSLRRVAGLEQANPLRKGGRYFASDS